MRRCRGLPAAQREDARGQPPVMNDHDGSPTADALWQRPAVQRGRARETENGSDEAAEFAHDGWGEGYKGRRGPCGLAASEPRGRRRQGGGASTTLTAHSGRVAQSEAVSKGGETHTQTRNKKTVGGATSLARQGQPQRARSRSGGLARTGCRGGAPAAFGGNAVWTDRPMAGGRRGERSEPRLTQPYAPNAAGGWSEHANDKPRHPEVAGGKQLTETTNNKQTRCIRKQVKQRLVQRITQRLTWRGHVELARLTAGRSGGAGDVDRGGAANPFGFA